MSSMTGVNIPDDPDATEVVVQYGVITHTGETLHTDGRMRLTWSQWEDFLVNRDKTTVFTPTTLKLRAVRNRHGSFTPEEDHEELFDRIVGRVHRGCNGRIDSDELADLIELVSSTEAPVAVQIELKAPFTAPENPNPFARNVWVSVLSASRNGVPIDPLPWHLRMPVSDMLDAVRVWKREEMSSEPVILQGDHKDVFWASGNVAAADHIMRTIRLYSPDLPGSCLYKFLRAAAEICIDVVVRCDFSPREKDDT